MGFPKFSRVIATVIAASTVAACGGSVSSNPNVFSGRVNDGVMKGTFDPQGYSVVQVRKLLTETCSGQFSGFGTQAQGDGRVSFTGTCTAWDTGARLATYGRMDGDKVIIEITGGDDRGNVLFSREIVQL